VSACAEVASWQADQLKDAQAKIDELAKVLDAERQRRQALEDALADLRKGS
jgi:septal ring factor EnvC (AmiA/AmiB activator)